MPDHWHMIWMGLDVSADQRLACAFLRKYVAPFLGSASFQDRAHDHVLRENERKRGAFQATCHYLRENPVRATLCVEWTDWPYSGAMIAGYPDLNHRAPDFWDTFWKIHARMIEAHVRSL